MQTTAPGFSSRTTPQHVQQFPQRDEANMTALQPEPGFSNSEHVEHAPAAVYPDVETPELLEAGYSNKRAVKQAAEEPAVDATPAKKAAAKKSAKKSS